MRWFYDANGIYQNPNICFCMSPYQKAAVQELKRVTHIHVDDWLVSTIDGGKQCIRTTGVEGQQGRGVAGVWACVSCVVPGSLCCACTSVCQSQHRVTHNEASACCVEIGGRLHSLQWLRESLELV